MVPQLLLASVLHGIFLESSSHTINFHGFVVVTSMNFFGVKKNGGGWHVLKLKWHGSAQWWMIVASWIWVFQVLNTHGGTSVMVQLGYWNVWTGALQMRSGFFSSHLAEFIIFMGFFLITAPYGWS
jgi:hypothetical protein